MKSIVDKSIILDRKTTYGNNFPIITKLWNNYLGQRFGTEVKLTEEDSAVLMALMKVSRLAQSPENEDSLTDLINYFWIGLNYGEYTEFKIDEPALEEDVKDRVPQVDEDLLLLKQVLCIDSWERATKVYNELSECTHKRFIGRLLKSRGQDVTI